ncbi:MAG: NAD(P)(+) transhydrogenase (Re/Si-specific) subunit alpha, partial [Rhodospirillaceae bacterium]|nr:NAD(P)(+) transhydrogenase (Re/Si-specific) subunit alpha [Rhodospirillaceae bacterium]
MKIVIAKERRASESRVAASPDVVRKLTAFGFDVAIEKDAGVGADVTDADFKAAGATIVADAQALLKSADVVLKIQRPDAEEIALLKKGTVIIAHLSAL